MALIVSEQQEMISVLIALTIRSWRRPADRPFTSLGSGVHHRTMAMVHLLPQSLVHSSNRKLEIARLSADTSGKRIGVNCDAVKHNLRRLRPIFLVDFNCLELFKCATFFCPI